MNFRALAAGALAMALVPAVVSAQRPMSLAEAVEYLKSQIPGDVVAAELDASGDRSAHFHMDVRLPHGRLARFEVDPVTGRIASRAPAAEPARGALSVVDVLAAVGRQVPGDVTRVELDDSDVLHQHYHVDVRLVGGRMARLKVDAVTGRIAGRNEASFDR